LLLAVYPLVASPSTVAAKRSKDPKKR